MSDQEKTKQETTASKPEAASAPKKAAKSEQKPSVKKPASKSSGSNGLLILLVLMALGAGGWASFQGFQLKQQLAAKTQVSEEQMATLGPDVQRLSQALQDESQVIDDRLVLLEQQSRGTQQALLDMRELVGREDRGWLLADVEYLTRVAIYRLDLMRDVEGSIAALNTADQRLATLNDPTLTELRREYAKGMRLLKEAPRIDRVGLALQLDEMINGLEPMALAPALSQAAVVEEDAAAAKADSRGWSNFPKALAEKLTGFVTVRRHDAPIAALPDAQTEQHVYQMLRLRLEAVRLAVMREDDARFHQELKAAQTWLKEYFHPSETEALLKELSELDALKLDLTLPSLTPLLKTLIAERKNKEVSGS